MAKHLQHPVDEGPIRTKMRVNPNIQLNHEPKRPRLRKRGHLRYSIDPDRSVRAEFKRLGYEKFWRPILIADESYSGCRVIAIGPDHGEVGDMLTIDFGDQPVVEAEIVRVEQIAPKVYSLGCRFVL